MAEATAPVGGTVDAKSHAAVAQAIPTRSLAGGLQSVAFATGLPSTADVQSLVVGSNPLNPTHPNVDTGLGVSDGSGDMLAHVVMGGAYARMVRATRTTTRAPSHCAFDLAQLSLAADLKIGLLDPRGHWQRLRQPGVRHPPRETPTTRC